jgi:hypothetical protein
MSDQVKAIAALCARHGLSWDDAARAVRRGHLDKYTQADAEPPALPSIDLSTEERNSIVRIAAQEGISFDVAKERYLEQRNKGELDKIKPRKIIDAFNDIKPQTRLAIFTIAGLFSNEPTEWKDEPSISSETLDLQPDRPERNEEKERRLERRAVKVHSAITQKGIPIEYEEALKLASRASEIALEKKIPYDRALWITIKENT